MAQGTGRKAGGGLARPVQPSADLAKITGNDPLPRSQVVSKVWDHIRRTICKTRKTNGKSSPTRP